MRIEDTLRIAREELEKAQSPHKAYFARKTKQRVFTTGDQVLVVLPIDSNKLLMRWKGPYSIESVVGECDYKVKVNGKVKIYLANLLKRFHQWEYNNDTANIVSLDRGAVWDLVPAAFLEIED